MNVDGSVTPVTFSYEFQQESAIGHLVVYMSDGSAFVENGFAALPRLTNGVQVKISTEELFIWKDTLDVVAALNRAGIPGTLFGKADRSLNGFIDFEIWGARQKGLYVKANQSLTVVINDDLTGLEFFEMTVHGIRIN